MREICIVATTLISVPLGKSENVVSDEYGHIYNPRKESCGAVTAFPFGERNRMDGKQGRAK